MYDILQLTEMKVAELREIAIGLDVNKAKTIAKQDLIYKILDAQAVSTAKADNKDSGIKSDSDNGDNKVKRKRKRIPKEEVGIEHQIKKEVKPKPTPSDAKREEPKDKAEKTTDKEETTQESDSKDQSKDNRDKRPIKPRDPKPREPKPRDPAARDNTKKPSGGNSSKRHYSFDVELEGVIDGFLLNILGALAAYAFKPKKPSIRVKFETKDDNQLFLTAA